MSEGCFIFHFTYYFWESLNPFSRASLRHITDSVFYQSPLVPGFELLLCYFLNGVSSFTAPHYSYFKWQHFTLFHHTELPCIFIWIVSLNSPNVYLSISSSKFPTVLYSPVSLVTYIISCWTECLRQIENIWCMETWIMTSCN